MSEDLMQDEEAETPVDRLAKRVRLLAIILVVLILLLAGGIGFGFTQRSELATELTALRAEVAKQDTGKEKAIEGMVVDQRRVGSLYDLGDFVVNLVDPGNVRYANCKIEIEVESAELLAVIEGRKALFRDAVVSVIGSHTYTELAGMEGKVRLREELVARFNRLMPKGQVARVYFTEFVIQ